MIKQQTIEQSKEPQFTLFWDMHSGGSQKLEWSKIYVNLPENEARIWFQKEFNRNCDHVTCSCCGEDYSVSSADSLEELTFFHRNKEYNRIDYEKTKSSTYDHENTITLEEYLNLDHVLYVEINKKSPE